VNGTPEPARSLSARPIPPAPSKAGKSHALRTMIIDIIAPIVVYYGARALGATVWEALIAGGAVPAVGVLASLVTRRRANAMGILVVAALAVSTALSLASGSPRALLARDALTTGAWACYMYLSLLAARPATFVVSRPLLEGRRVWDSAARAWVRPPAVSWDVIWERTPRFRRIWRICTVIWGSAILADAIVRIVMAYTLPINTVPALAGALWPVTFIALQVATNVYFARSGLWRILRSGGVASAEPATA
jgi:hypothetical protein